MMVLEFVKALLSLTLAQMSGSVGVILTIITPFLPEKLGAKAPVVATAVLCFIIAFYAAWAAERRKVLALTTQVAGQGKLDIVFEPGIRRFEEELGGLYETVSRTVSVAVVNLGGSSVSGCKLWAVSVEPNEGSLPPDMQMHSMPSITLNPGDRSYVQIATFIEPKPNFPGDTMGLLHIPFKSEGKPSIANERTFGADTSYVVTLRATGNGSAPCTRSFKLWVGGGRLKLERLPS